MKRPSARKRKPKLPPAKWEPKRLLTIAVAFHEAGVRCDKGEKVSIASVYNFLAHPAVVCSALSVELFLKLLLLLENRDIPREHNLYELYSRLSVKSRRRMAEMLGRSMASMRKHLVPLSDAFQEWRYAHEYEFLAIDSDELSRIAVALRRIIREKKEDLLSNLEGEMPPR